MMHIHTHRLSRYCPSCHGVFALAMSYCPHCKRLGSINSEHKIAMKLWLVEMLPDGTWRYHQPESLNPAAVRHLARTHEAPDGDAA